MKYCWNVPIAALVVSTALSSCSLPDAGHLDKEANSHVLQVLDGQKGRWDGQRLYQAIDPTAKISMADSDSICDLYNSVLGPLQEHGPITRVNFKSGVGINIPEYVGAYSVNVSCAKDKGIASITVHKRNGKWYLLNFNIDSPAIEKSLSADQKSASAFVDRIVPLVCSTWRYEDVQENADSDLKAQLQNGALQTKALLAVSSKGLGKLEKYDGAKFTNFTSVKGHKVISFIAKADFANGRANIPVTVSQESDGWKLRSINFNAGPKLR